MNDGRMASGKNLVLVGVAVLAEPEAQELLVDVAGLLPCRVPLRVCVRQPVAAAVRRVDLQQARPSIDCLSTEPFHEGIDPSGS